MKDSIDITIYCPNCNNKIKVKFEIDFVTTVDIPYHNKATHELNGRFELNKQCPNCQFLMSNEIFDETDNFEIM